MYRKKLNALWSDLDRIYEENPKSNVFLSGNAPALQKAANAEGNKHYSLTEIKKYLSEKEAYTLHRQPEHAFARNHFVVTAPFILFEMDLMDTKSSSKDNDDNTFILFVIDCFSKFVWFRAVKNKSAQTISKALREIIDDECSQYPEAISSDLGKEFHNFRVKELLASRKIKHHRPQTASAWKCPMIERFLRTIKLKIRRYLTFTKKRRYVDALPLIVRNYNDTVHSSTKFKPSEVTYKNTPEVYKNLRALHRKDYVVLSKQNLQTGDLVRTAIKKKPLDAGVFKPEMWSREIFKIDEVINKRPIKLYTITDLKKRKIFGKFYEKQLQKIETGADFKVKH